MKKQIENFIWPQDIVEKCIQKHSIYEPEVESVFFGKPRFYFREKGDVEGEDLYQCLGQTDDGRYVTIYFIEKKTGEALIISARDMTQKEKKRYAKK